MYMTDAEIVRRYNESDNKNLTVKILAELNAVDKNDIEETLSKNGIIIIEKNTQKITIPELVLEVLKQHLKTIEKELSIRNALNLSDKRRSELRHEYTVITMFLEKYGR